MCISQSNNKKMQTFTNEIRSIAERIREIRLDGGTGGGCAGDGDGEGDGGNGVEKKEQVSLIDSGIESKLQIPIGIFWDIENCRIKRGCSFLQVSKAIRDKFLDRYWEAEFTVVCDVLKEPEKSIGEINAAQVSLIHCPSTSKNAADEKLKQLIRRFADIHKSNCSIVLISNDVNFAGDLFGLRYRNQINVILVHTRAASETLIACANENYDFESFFQANQLVTSTNFDRCVDFRIRNLPDWQTDSLLKNRLSRLSENCGGKVLGVRRGYGYDSHCEAIVRFPNTNSALRAQQRMDGEDIYGKRITLQNVSAMETQQAAAFNRANMSSNNLVQRRNIPFNRYTAYPPHNRQQRLTNIAETSSTALNSYHNQSYDFGTTTSAWPSVGTTGGGGGGGAGTTQTQPVDLLVNNLDSRFNPQTMKQTLSDLFKNYAMVLNISVTIQSEGNMVAHIKVANLQDAQFAISKLQRLKIGCKRITIQFAPERVDLSLLRWQIVLLLQDVPGCRLPLFKFLELFKARFRSTISLSILYKLRDVCTINDDLFGNIKSRFISLVLKNSQPMTNPAYQLFQQQQQQQQQQHQHQQQQEDEFRDQQQLETWYCPKHYTLTSSEKGWAELDSIKMPNILMPLKDFTNAIHSLLESHNGYLPLYSLPYCYASVVGDLKVNEDGVPLEHYVTRVPDIELCCTSINRVKYLKWSRKSNSNEFDLMADGGGSECGQKSILSSTPLAVKTSLLSRELIDLLKTIKKCQLPLSKFIPAYHYHFGRQCRVADYGYTKLDDLLEALANVIQVMGEGEARLLTLNHQTQTKRFTYDLLKVLKFQKNKQILSSEFAETFERIVNKKFDPVDYGLCSLSDLLANISKNMVLVTKVEDVDEFVISVPKKEQSPEEVMRTKHFALEAVELLRHMPQCTLLFRKFVTAYHHHFGRQCRLSDYGFTKLIELFEAIPEVVRIDDSYDLDKKICLTLPYHIRIVGEQLVQVIRRTWPSEKIALDAIENVYLKEYGYALQPEAFNCLNIDELILKLSDFVKFSYDQLTIYVIVNDGTRIEQLILRVWSVLINVPHCLPTFVFLKEYFRKHNSSFELCQLHELNSVINITHAGQSKITISLTPFYIMLAKIYWLLYDCDGRLAVVDFSRKYLEKYREHLQPVQFGSDDLVDLLRKMIHVVVLKGKQNPIVYLSPDLKAFNVDLPPINETEPSILSPLSPQQSSTRIDSTTSGIIGRPAALLSPLTPSPPLSSSSSSLSLSSTTTTTSIKKHRFPASTAAAAAAAVPPPKPDSPTTTTLTTTSNRQQSTTIWTPFNTPNFNDLVTNKIVGALLPKIEPPKFDSDYIKSLYSPTKGLMSAYTGHGQQFNRTLADDLTNLISSNNNNQKKKKNTSHTPPDPSKLPCPDFY